MRIAELYRSIQGEGSFTGTESVFIRLSGCNLRCAFCDTPYTSWEPEGSERTVSQVVAEVLALRGDHAVITGGEPMLSGDLIPLCEQLRAHRIHITIETAGTVDLPVACDLMSISPKMSNSTPSLERAGPWRARHERDRHAPQVIRRLLRDYAFQLKFVVGHPNDCVEVLDYLKSFPEVGADQVWLMPQGTDLPTLQAIESWLKPYCDARGFHFCPRKHIEWYGFTRGT